MLLTLGFWMSPSPWFQSLLVCARHWPIRKHSGKLAFFHPAHFPLQRQIQGLGISGKQRENFQDAWDRWTDTQTEGREVQIAKQSLYALPP